MDIEQILKNSSLRGMISTMEIAELADELSVEIDEIVESAKEEAKEDAEEAIESLRRRNRIANEELEALKRTMQIPINSLDDEMTLSWVKENWEDLVKMEKMNKSGKEILSLVSYAEHLEKLSKEAAPEVSNATDREILAEAMLMRTEQDHMGIEDGTPVLDATWVAKSILMQNVKEVSTHKRIVLVGRAASGKDHMRKELESKGYKYAVSYTTRPPRDGEVDGKDYFFLSEEKFKEMIANDEFYEYVTFNNWYYGTTKAQFYSDDVFIMTPHGISHIDPNDRKNTFIIFLDMKYGVRQRRLLQRSDADSVERRLAADEKDFENFKDFDVRITNHDF